MAFGFTSANYTGQDLDGGSTGFSGIFITQPDGSLDTSLGYSSGYRRTGLTSNTEIGLHMYNRTGVAGTNNVPHATTIGTLSTKSGFRYTGTDLVDLVRTRYDSCIQDNLLSYSSGSGTSSLPVGDGNTRFDILLVGGGGGGGGGSHYSGYDGGGGGGGGGGLLLVKNVKLSSTPAYSVGRGGTGGARNTTLGFLINNNAQSGGSGGSTTLVIIDSSGTSRTLYAIAGTGGTAGNYGTNHDRPPGGSGGGQDGYQYLNTGSYIRRGGASGGWGGSGYNNATSIDWATPGNSVVAATIAANGYSISTPVGSGGASGTSYEPDSGVWECCGGGGGGSYGDGGHGSPAEGNGSAQAGTTGGGGGGGYGRTGGSRTSGAAGARGLIRIYYNSLVMNVIYSANGATSGTAPVDSNNHYENSSVTVLGNTGNLERTGYIFDGWNTAANGSGTSYSPGATFTVGSSPVTLYAKWIVPITITAGTRTEDTLCDLLAPYIAPGVIRSCDSWTLSGAMVGVNTNHIIRNITAIGRSSVSSSTYYEQFSFTGEYSTNGGASWTPCTATTTWAGYSNYYSIHRGYDSTTVPPHSDYNYTYTNTEINLTS